jgi:hypothetical protein
MKDSFVFTNSETLYFYTLGENSTRSLVGPPEWLELTYHIANIAPPPLLPYDPSITDVHKAPRAIFHRVDGPAVIWKDQVKWFLGGVEYASERHLKEILEEVQAMPQALRLTDPRQWVREL